MEPTIEELEQSLEKLSLEQDPPLRLHPRESYPEIKSPMATAIKDVALLIVQKRNDANEWKNVYSEGRVFDDRSGGVSQTIDGLQINVFQRSDSSMSIQIFDEGYCTATMHKDIPNREFELQLLDTNSRGEAVSFLPEHSIYARMGLSKDEFAHLITTRLEEMANKIDRQVAIEQGNTLDVSSLPLVNEEAETIELLPKISIPIATSSEAIKLQQEAYASVVIKSSTWIDSIKSQIDNIDSSKLQIFSGASKVYEQNNNKITLDNLENALGQKVQQALENPTQLQGSVRVLVDGEKIYHVKGGEVLENKYSLALERQQLALSSSPEIVTEIPQVIEPEKKIVQLTQDSSLKIVTEIPQVIETKEQNIQSNQSIAKLALAISPEVEVASSVSLPPQELVVPAKNEQIDSASAQKAQPINLEAREKAIFELIARQEVRINHLEQKLAAITQNKSHNPKVNNWLGALNQTAKEAVQEVKARSLHIPQNVRQFLANKSNQIQSGIKEQIKTTRTEVVSKVNEIKSSFQRQLADVAGKTLNASTRYLAERFGEDNGAGIKVFQGNSLIITSSSEHSGIYSKDGKQLVRDGEFVSSVTSEQLSKIAQVPTEAQKLNQAETQVRAKALR